MTRYIITILLFAPFAARAAAPQWKIDTTHSSISFDDTQSGQAFTGDFKKFDGKITFDPDHLNQSYANITIDIDSISAGTDGDQYVKTPQWFDTRNFATAKFVTSNFETVEQANKKAPPQFIAHGKLTIRDVTLPVDLPFTLTFAPDGKSAKMQGQLTLNRLDYHLGTGDWADPKTVGTDVNVRVNVMATKTP